MLFDCFSYRWSPEIGDPTIIGWVTVFAYFFAAGIAFLRSRDAFAIPGAAELKVFWLGLSILMLLLGINKQLDLQSALTAAGRCLAFAQGWYETRRGVQVAFMLIFAGLGAAAALACLWLMRRHLRSHQLVISGAGLLLIFVMLRASSFHHMDSFINTRLIGVKMNWILELGGLAMIIAGSRHPLPSRPGTPTPHPYQDRP